ncbi:MAG: F0F1 ATP synthase subunit epsilon [Actinomycetota bacterium]|nr:F0F1 ATP synthase subunit epsilon [Actinomycetota bacterium]
MADLHVEVVSVESEVWSGEASMLIARTTEGEVGILPGHTSLLGELAEGGTVRIQQAAGGEVVAAVHGGFLSVTDQGVTVLAEVAELSGDIDQSRARAALDRARTEGDESAARRAEGRLRAVGALS